MGGSASKAASKAPKLRYDKIKPLPVSQTSPSGAVSEALDGGKSAQELLAQKPEAAAAQLLTDDSADPHLAGFLDRLGGSIQGRRVNITAPEADRARLKQHAADVKQNIKGVRLDTMVLRCLFEDAKSPKFQEAEKIDVQKLADEYGVDIEVLRTVLRYNATPVLSENEDGQLLGKWPNDLPEGQQV